MNEFFLQPGMLYLAAGAVVPVIIHLLRRRQVAVVRFPALRFLRRSTRRSARRTNLKQLLLLLLRIAAIVLLAALLARPRPVGGGRMPNDEIRMPNAAPRVVIVLDDSLSMSYRSGSTAWFERARSSAMEILDGLSAWPGAGGPEVAVTTTGRPVVQFVTDHDEARGRLLALRPTMAGGTCWAALEQAAAALKERADGGASLYLLTDMTRSAWHGLEARRATPLDLGPRAELDIVTVGEEDAANLAVTGVGHEGEPTLQGAVLNLKAELLCVGAAREESVQFEFDGRVIGRRTVRLGPEARGPGETTSVALRVPITSPGHHWGRVSLLNADALPQDDARAFSLTSTRAIRVLCVDADGGGGWTGGSAFFRRALRPWQDEARGIFHVKTVRPEELEREPLGDVDLVALIDTPAPPPKAWERLAAFVSGGGALLVSVGAEADAEGYAAEHVARVLPAGLGRVYRPAPPSGDAPAPGMRIRVVGARHPLTLALDEAGADMGRSTWLAARRIEPSGAAEEVLSFGPDLPALVLGGLGGGRTAVFAGGMGPGWSNFPREPEFVPFCHELALYLTAASAGRPSAFLVGEHVPIRFDPAARPTTVAVTPPGEQEPVLLTPGTTPGRRIFWKTGRPGYYRVKFSGGGDGWEEGFAVNTAPLESDLRRVAAEDVRAAIRAAAVRVHADAAALRAARGASGQWPGSRGGFDPTSLVALLALAACLAEVILANRIYRPSRQE